VSTWPSVAEARECLRSGTGKGIKVAVLDSGVEAVHPALHGLTLADDLAILEAGASMKITRGGGQDMFGHGTAIASIIRQMAPEAEIGSFRVLGSQLRSRTAIISEGVRQALDRGYHILNCSFGCGRDEHVLHYKNWIDEAYVQGRHIVAACNNLDFLKREWPGHFPTVITVYFSDCEKPDQFFYRPGSLVEFAARGQDIEVPWLGGGQKKVTGSSFSAPHITGLLARLLSRLPDLSPLQAKALLRELATPLVLPSSSPSAV
jgi:subtilisin family serine protease